MTTYKIGEKEYQMVDSAEELLVSQYFQIEELLKDITTLTNSQIILKMVEILSNVKHGDIDDIDVESASKLGEIIGAIDFKNIKSTNKDYIVINGIDYVFKNNMDKLSMGEQISIELLQKRSLNLVDSSLYSLAILLRPGTSTIDKESKKVIWTQEKFNTDNLEYRVELFREHLKAVDALGVLRFFLTGSNELEKSIPHSTQGKHQQKKKVKELLKSKSQKI